MDKVLHDSDVIITGVAGCFPKSRNVAEFLDNLFNGRDLLSDVPSNWKVALPNLPPKIGKVNGLEKFDSGYFGIHHQQATDMDPACRKLLEMSIEVFLDAGINPIEMRGSRTGVYICTMYTETEKLFYGPKLVSPTLGMSGYTRSAYAQRISYHLGLEGPSVCLDAACSGSMYAMEMAIRAIQAGECNNALVGGANLLLNRNVLMQSARLGLLSPGAKSKVFDQSEDGYVRSEAVSLIFLQKFEDAKRIYAQIVHVRTNCDGFKERGISYPSSEMLVELIEGLYGEVGIDPTTVSFVECHATGTRQSDFEELSAINNTFCKGRGLPLVVGSVKANIGHSEAASGLCSLIKILGSMEVGCVPPQIHCENLRDDIEAFRSGKCIIARQCLPLEDWDGKYWAMNNSGFGGTNAHVLLRNYKTKDLIPHTGTRLVCVSGRTGESVENILLNIRKNSASEECLSFWNNMFRNSDERDSYRGYALITDGTVIHQSHSVLVRTHPRLRIVFASENVDWLEMYFTLNNISNFNEKLQNVNKILRPLGFEANALLQKTHCTERERLVANVAVQVAIAQTLKSFEFSHSSLGLKFAINYCLPRKPLENFPYAPMQRLMQEVEIDNWESDVAVTLIIGEVVSHDNDMVIKDLPSFWNALGRLYQMGFNPNLLNASPEKYHPIRAPLISPLIQWNHAEGWPVYEYNTAIPLGYELHNITFGQVSKELNFLLEHQIDGRSIVPSTGYVYLAWKTFCQMMGVIMEETAVVFQELRFYQACVFTKDTNLNLVVHISRMGKKFEITQSDNLLASGTIKIKSHETVTHTVHLPLLAEDAIFTEDIYTKLDLHGYEHKGVFRALQSINHKSTQALSKWSGNWIAFLDTVLQVNTFQLDSLTLSLPTAISYVSVDPNVRPTLDAPISFQRESRKVWSDGVEIRNVTLTPTPKKTNKPILESYQFVSFVALLPSANALRVNIQLIMENLQTKTLSVMELNDQFSTSKAPLTPIIEEIIEDTPQVILTHSSPVQLVIMSSASQRPEVAQELMEKSQFLLSREPASSGGLPQMEIVTEYQTEEEFLVLLKAVRDYKEPNVISVGTHGWLKSLQSTLNANQGVLLTDNNSKSGILGFLNSLSLEVGRARVSCAFNMDGGSDARLEDQMQKSLRFNVLKGGQWGTYRHLPLGRAQEFPYEHIITKSEVHYAGLHLRYVHEELRGIAGLEYSCVNSSGKKVMRLKDLSWDIPKEWSLEDATTVPLTYATILYALIEVAKLRLGQSVLIVGGDSDMGMAASSVAHYYKCNVFNMNTNQKEIDVMKKTKGKGVDIILNCLEASKLRTFVHYLATGGKLIEFGHSDVPLQVANMQYSRSFYWIDQNSVVEMVQISSLVSKGIELGYVRPLPRVTYDANEIEEACRYLTSNATTKRVIIRMSSHLQVRTNRFQCDPHKVYVLIGGLGGLGLEMTDWLIARNCRKVVMGTRSNPQGYQKYKIRRWTDSGVKVVVECRELSKEGECDALLRIASALGEVDAIFNLAASLSDGLLENQTESTFAAPFLSKVTITEHLNRTSRTICPSLRHFVVFSSVSAGRGNVGVTNYAMANSAMERICEERKRDGFPALAIQWGPIGSVGLMRDSPKRSRIIGCLNQSVSSFLKELEKLLVRQEPVVSCMVLASKDNFESRSNDIMSPIYEIIGVRNSQHVSLHVPLAKMGLDSLSMMELRSFLENNFGITFRTRELTSATLHMLKGVVEEKISFHKGNKFEF